MKYTKQDLKIMQAWNLERKIQVTQTRITEWYQHFDGQVYVSFSGGKDSTVLLDLARRIYPDIEAVFVDTGLEYPEIREFVKTFDNVAWIKPEKTFDKIIAEYGYPVISKETSKKIRQIKNPNVGDRYRTAMLYGDERGNYTKIAEKWKKLLDAPFDCSEQCCEFMKKKPFAKHEKLSRKKPISGQMAFESRGREKIWLERGCNAFEGRSMSNPMGFWTEQDVFQYLKLTEIPYCKIYGEIIKVVYENNLMLKMTGLGRTGCMFCMFGVHLEKEPNRFQQMKETHPKQYDYCINKLGCGKVLDYIGVKY